MNKNTIERMLNNSSWINPEEKIVYKFINAGFLSINGAEYLPYSINSVNNRIVLQIGTDKSYNVEFVNDFILRLYNNKESFRITPE
ncbi:MAG: hypothetical protein HC831_25130 [Chloroflexia bacterium]|nr:hypothetical protein [Chloroflexia bacterium]